MIICMLVSCLYVYNVLVLCLVRCSSLEFISSSRVVVTHSPTRHYICLSYPLPFPPSLVYIYMCMYMYIYCIAIDEISCHCCGAIMHHHPDGNIIIITIITIAWSSSCPHPSLIVKSSPSPIITIIKFFPCLLSSSSPFIIIIDHCHRHDSRSAIMSRHQPCLGLCMETSLGVPSQLHQHTYTIIISIITWGYHRSCTADYR